MITTKCEKKNYLDNNKIWISVTTELKPMLDK